jgi:hypothetical protein
MLGWVSRHRHHESAAPGAVLVRAGTARELEGFRWRQMADPDGNEFDIDVQPAEVTS